MAIEAVMESVVRTGPPASVPQAEPAPAQAVADQEPGMGRTVPFRAEVELAELDESGSPGPAWPGRIREVSRTHVAILTRRMCYCGRRLRVTVQATEGSAKVLAGEVESCEYKAAGMHRIVLSLVVNRPEELRRSG
jgi:hypothetical protein